MEDAAISPILRNVPQLACGTPASTGQGTPGVLGKASLGTLVGMALVNGGTVSCGEDRKNAFGN